MIKEDKILSNKTTLNSKSQTEAMLKRKTKREVEVEKKKVLDPMRKEKFHQHLLNILPKSRVILM